MCAALTYSTNKSEFEKAAKRDLGEKASEYLKSLPDFNNTYQTWYSEAKSLIQLLTPNRITDFTRLYEKPTSRKDITFENYTIEDSLIGLSVHRTVGMQRDIVVGPDAAIPRIKQQLAIVQAAKGRFESSLFDIRQMLQADLFDSELGAAKHLLQNKFTRAAGALCGVVLERHLAEVCSNHQVQPRKKNPTIADLNDALKKADVIAVDQWRFIQLLGDIRNLCDHSKTADPTPAKVQELLDGVDKLIKTIL